MNSKDTMCFKIFRECVRAIHDGELIVQESQKDKEFHFQNWCQKRLENVGLHFEGTGRNIYPDFCLVEKPEGYEIKGLAYPGREKDYDANSNVPTGVHNGRQIFYIFGRYPNDTSSYKAGKNAEYPVIDLVLCHGDFMNAQHDYVHKNKHVKGFGTYGDIMIRDRKMYVVPTPFALTNGTAGLATLILPAEIDAPEGFKCVGDLSRIEGNSLILNGDSANLPIPDESVDFVVTDPPYFDFIHYSELSDFFYAWLGPLLKDTYSFFGGDTSRRDNEVQQTDARAFSMLLGGVFKESNRVLKPNGRLAFSFHHSRVEGWIAIYNAIKSAGLFVIDTFPIHAELMASTPKNSAKDPISLDAIIICGKTAPIIRDTVDTTRAIIDFLNIMSEHGKKLSSADVFVICCSQCLQKCIAENMDEDEVCSYIKKTFKELLLLWKNSENNMGR